MRQKLVAGNWKMHGSLDENQALLNELRIALADMRNMACAVCVPSPYLAQTQSVLADSPIGWGAQNMSEYAKGAYTGEVSASMLLDFGCHYVIIGHSERRALYGETDQVVAAKFAAAIKAGLTPILCVGETLAEREADMAESVIARQLDAVLAVSGMAGMAQAVIAYEPVWAIGTGKTASPAQAQAVHAFIRQKLAVQDADIAERLVIQYGGSVKAANAAELFSQPDIDGGLIGGASLVADEFVAICKAAQS
ncbi:triose-phosphate isomerase [Sulfuriferula sp. AH1]|uniref:triose-phosphate isomerase n=1 Tax=Sulfuriferula sp. AH1 TaxID=1985873 RepID=UPI000B3B8933|nr:triose-phosphate isomerase [Sulfuriferula sp. AH1]ARU30710.1 triose-phosphate isomerase [Sulfuriferula sp. AH1]